MQTRRTSNKSLTKRRGQPYSELPVGLGATLSGIDLTKALALASSLEDEEIRSTFRKLGTNLDGSTKQT